MAETYANRTHSAEIRIRRYNGVPECDVVVFVRGKEIMIRCRDYDQAVKWARIECKSYKVADGFMVDQASGFRSVYRNG